MGIEEYLKEKKKVIDTYLEEYFDKPFSPSILFDAIKYSLFAGGKRIRPILCITAYETCGGNINDIIPQAGALELIHSYSLIHDDLPAMDDDDLRRGKPTNHKVFGEAMAILSGDALLTEALFMFSKNDKISGDILINAISELSSSAGIKGMVAGQAMDIIYEGKTGDKKTLEFIHRKKTAELIKASVKIGSILSNAEERQINALSKYGENIGLAFQIVDDILDITGTTEDLGKPKGSDNIKKKITYPSIYGLEKSKVIANEYVSNAIKALEIFNNKANWLTEIAQYLLRRTN